MFVQAALEAIAEQCPQRLGPRPFEQPLGQAHAFGRKVHREWTVRAAVPVRQVPAAKHGRGRGLVERRRVHEATAGWPLERGRELLHPPVAAEIDAGRGLVLDRDQPLVGHRRDPRVQPERAQVQGLGHQLLEGAGGALGQVIDGGPELVKSAGDPAAVGRPSAVEHAAYRRRQPLGGLAQHVPDGGGGVLRPRTDVDEFRFLSIRGRGPQVPECASLVFEERRVPQQSVEQRRGAAIARYGSGDLEEAAKRDAVVGRLGAPAQPAQVVLVGGQRQIGVEVRAGADQRPVEDEVLAGKYGPADQRIRGELNGTLCGRRLRFLLGPPVAHGRAQKPEQVVEIPGPDHRPTLITAGDGVVAEDGHQVVVGAGGHATHLGHRRG